MGELADVVGLEPLSQKELQPYSRLRRRLYEGHHVGRCCGTIYCSTLPHAAAATNGVTLLCSERWLLFGSDQDSNLEVLISIVGRCAYMCARASGADCGSDDPHRARTVVPTVTVLRKLMGHNPLRVHVR